MHLAELEPLRAKLIDFVSKFHRLRDMLTHILHANVNKRVEKRHLHLTEKSSSQTNLSTETSLNPKSGHYCIKLASDNVIAIG